jgi:hypothetical protein
LFDAAFGVLAVAAHVPLSNGAVRAGNRIGAADNAHHQIARLQSAGRSRIQDAPKGFMTQHEARLSRRCPAILTLHDLDVRPTNADGDGFHEYRTLMCIGLRNIFEPYCPGLLWFYGNRFHGVISFLCSTDITFIG